MMISASQGFINQSDRYDKDNAGTSKSKYTLIKYGELSYNHGNSKIKKYGAVFAMNNKGALIPFVYHTFSIRKPNNPFYFAKYLNLNMHNRYLKKVISSGARMDGLLNISLDDFFKMPINYPSLEEQNKINDFLEKTDIKINLINDKISILKKYKKGTQKNIFDSSKAKEYLILKNIVKLENKSKIPANSSIENGNYIFYKSGQKNGMINDYSHEGIYIIANDGGIAQFKLTSGKFAYTDHCICFRCQSDEETIVLCNYLQSLEKKITYVGFTGTGLKNIDRQYLGMIRIPKVNNKKIAKSFNLIDEAIRNYENILEKITIIKKLLFKQMFI